MANKTEQEGWDEIMDKLDEEGHLATYRRFMAREARDQDDDQDEGEYDPADQLERDIQ